MSATFHIMRRKQAAEKAEAEAAAKLEAEKVVVVKKATRQKQYK